MYGVPEGLGPQRYMIAYRKTKLEVIVSTALLLVAKLINVR